MIKSSADENIEKLLETIAENFSENSPRNIKTQDTVEMVRLENSLKDVNDHGGNRKEKEKVIMDFVLKSDMSPKQQETTLSAAKKYLDDEDKQTELSSVKRNPITGEIVGKDALEFALAMQESLENKIDIKVKSPQNISSSKKIEAATSKKASTGMSR